MVGEELIVKLRLAVEYPRDEVVGASCVLARGELLCEVLVLEDEVVRLEVVRLVDYQLLIFLN